MKRTVTFEVQILRGFNKRNAMHVIQMLSWKNTKHDKCEQLKLCILHVLYCRFFS